MYMYECIHINMIYMYNCIYAHTCIHKFNFGTVYYIVQL